MCAQQPALVVAPRLDEDDAALKQVLPIDFAVHLRSERDCRWSERIDRAQTGANTDRLVNQCVVPRLP